MKSHIQLSHLETDKAIVCGAPERAEFISSLLQNPKKLAANREYHSYIGSYEGSSILVTSHGVGSAGAAICFQELADIGIGCVVRLGTAGGLQEDFQIGDIVIPTAAIRNDGVSHQMVPSAFPAVSDFALTEKLIHLATGEKKVRQGIVLTSDLFYPGPLGSSDLEFYKKLGVQAVEMECATLFIIGQLRRIQTAAVLVLDGNPLRWQQGDYDPSPSRLENSVTRAAKMVLGVLSR